MRRTTVLAAATVAAGLGAMGWLGAAVVGEMTVSAASAYPAMHLSGPPTVGTSAHPIGFPHGVPYYNGVLDPTKGILDGVAGTCTGECTWP